MKDKLMIGSGMANSTLIRQYLMKGTVKHASSLPGYSFVIEEMVVHGNKIGQNPGFPTAGIIHDNPYKIIPSYAGYAVLVEIEGYSFKGRINTGIRPTLKENPAY